MKTKKLLPIISVASITAVVTPIIASCGNKTYNYDFTKGFKPSIKQKKTNISLSQATEIYLSDASKNPRILTDDIAYTFYTLYIPLGSTYEKLSVFPKKIDVKNKLISLRLTAEGMGAYPAYPDDYYKIEVEIENIPVQINYFNKEGVEAGGAQPLVDEDFFSNDQMGSFYQKDKCGDNEPSIHEGNSKKWNEISEEERTLNYELILLGISTALPMMSYYFDGCRPIE